MSNEEKQTIDTINEIVREINRLRKRREVLEHRLERLGRIFRDNLHDGNIPVEDLKTRVTKILQVLSIESSETIQKIREMYKELDELQF